MLTKSNLNILSSYYNKYIDNDGYMYGFTLNLLIISSIRCKYLECNVYHLDILSSLTRALDAYFFLLC